MKAILWAGLGAGRKVTEQALVSLSPYLDIQVVKDPKHFKQPNWEKEIDVIIFGGGRASGFVESLTLNCTDYEPLLRIKNFVYEGGKYIGLCAGAYFASTRIEFEQGTKEGIATEMTLGLSNTVARGAVYKGYSKESENSLIVGVDMINDIGCDHLESYYYGGSEFILNTNADQSQFKILATYSNFESPKTAMLITSFGKGLVFQSGIHPEVYEHFEPDKTNLLRQADFNRSLVFNYLNATFLHSQLQ